MSYEIPKELKYQEKMMLGLTFKQVMYGLITLLIVGITCTKDIPVISKIVFSTIPTTIALIFMFTNWPYELLFVFDWLSFQNLSPLSYRMKKYLSVTKINDDHFVSNGKKTVLIEVTPINFAIKNEDDKKAIISRFQKFLNSIDFNIQIVMQTTKLDFDDYISKLEKENERNNNFQEYKEFLESHINKQGLFNRGFYLVIQEKEEVGLDIQVEVCKKVLGDIGLKYKLLHKNEITNCISSFFNDVYKDKLNKKKIKPNDYLQYLLAPKQVTNNSEYLKLGDYYTKTIAVCGYPRVVKEGFLDQIITMNGNVDLSLHIEPFSNKQTMVMLNSEIIKQRSDLWSMQQKQIQNPYLELQHADTKNVFSRIQKGDEKLFNISLYITCKAESLSELDILVKKVQAELGSILIESTKPSFRMHQGLKSTSPLGVNSLGITQNITTRPLSAFFPFTSQFLDLDDDGVWLGNNKNKIPIIKDLFKCNNSNGLILASSGGGKSYFTKLLISRYVMNKTKVMVIDPQNEYTELTKKHNGQVVNISKDSDTIINPLDLMGHEYDSKKLILLDLFKVMLGDVSEVQKAVLDKMLTRTYERKGITREESTWGREPPIMEDLLHELKQESRKVNGIERETYRSLMNRLEMFVTGVFSFVNRKTNINFDNPFVCFKIGSMPSQIKPTIMFLILDYVYMKMQGDLDKKLLIVDEAWSLLQRAEDEGYIFRIVKTCRKFNLGLLMITQDVDDLIHNKAGKALLNNSEFTLLLRQRPSIIDAVKKTFKLSRYETDKLISASPGEGIFILANEHSDIQVVASPNEHKIITTNPNEPVKKKAKVYTHKPLNYNKGYFKKKDLKDDEIEELLGQGYTMASLVGLKGGRREDFLLKPRSNESIEHFFVIKEIELFLKKHFKKVELYETVEADIVFEHNGKKIAIEVETGFKIKKSYTSRIEEKVKLCNEKYDEWYFVTINFRDKRFYGKFGQVLGRTDFEQFIKKKYVFACP
jgi:type IV secretory pathway VirB4 component